MMSGTAMIETMLLDLKQVTRMPGSTRMTAGY
jgi:hypothetical protein